MKKKNLLASLVVLGLCFSASSVSASATSPVPTVVPPIVEDNYIQIPIPLDVQARLQEGSGEVRTLVITDKEELEQIARKEGSEKIPVRVEYEYRPSTNEHQNTMTAAKATVTTWDRGSGWYRPTADLHAEYRVQGPDTFTISRTEKKNSSFTGSFGVSVSVIEAAIGFNIGTERTVLFQSTTPIAAGQTCLLQLYTTNHRVDYTVHTSTSSTPGEAYDPNGTFIQKTFY